jgi:hypothetical protein
VLRTKTGKNDMRTDAPKNNRKKLCENQWFDKRKP